MFSRSFLVLVTVLYFPQISVTQVEKVVFRDGDNENVTLSDIEKKSLLTFESDDVTFQRVKRLEVEDSNFLSSQEDSQSRENTRISDLQALEKLQRYRQKHSLDSPRGVQDQFIEMLGNSEFIFRDASFPQVEFCSATTFSRALSGPRNII